MEFSMTEQQVPMLMRLLQLAIALKRREFKMDAENQVDPTSSLMMESVENLEGQESWAGWAWSFVPSILPSASVIWDEDWNNEEMVFGHFIHIGFYVDNATVTFKVNFCKTAFKLCKIYKLLLGVRN